MSESRGSLLLRADLLPVACRRLGVVPHGAFQLFLPAPGVTAVFRTAGGDPVAGPMLATPHTAFSTTEVVADGPVLSVSVSHTEALRALGGSLERARNRLLPLDRRLGTAFAATALRDGAAALGAMIEDAWPPIDGVDATLLARIAATSTLHQLGRHLGVGARQVQRHYLARTGIPSSGWRLIARLRAAREAVHCRPDLTLAQIAHDAGFHDQAHFNREFRRFTGQSPGQARRAPAFDVVSIQDDGRVSALSPGVLAPFT